MEFPEISIEYNYFVICDIKKTKPRFHHNLPLNYSQKRAPFVSIGEFTSDYTFAIAHVKKTKKQNKTKQNKKHYQIQVTKGRKCIGTYNNITSAENYNTKMVTNSRLSSDREQERFNALYCQSGRTQCANSQFHLAFLTLHELEKQLFSRNFRSRVSHSLSLLKKCL